MMYQIDFNYYTISLLIGAFTALISGFVVFIHDRKRLENQAWFALTMCTAIWSSAYFYMTIANSYTQGFWGNWILHYAAICIPLFYFILVLTLTNTLKKYQKKLIVYIVIAFIFITINLSPLFVSDVIPKVGFNYAPVPGHLYFLFLIYFIVLVLDGIVTTYRVAINSTTPSIKSRLWYTIIFTIAASVGGGSVFLTTFSTNIPPYPLILFSLYPAISGYAILRYQLFDVRVVTAQIFTFSLWIAIFVRVLLSQTTQEQIFNAILLLITIVLGLLLNRSVKREVSQREKIELLAADLQKANDRLRELDKQKSEFVSFATHQLRAPLTAMKGYASLILEGDLGKLSREMKSAITRIYDSSNTLASIVDDYLNISRIELGSMKYSFENVDLKDVLDNVIGELRPNIEKSGIKFEIDVDRTRKYMVHVDKDKFKQIIANLIDNALKYTPTGTLTVSIKNKRVGTDAKIIFAVKDTGIGIAGEVLPKLFAKFTRAENGSRQNIHGTGLGLYVAKEIVTAHKGRIWAESPGEGRGSTFSVELEEAI
jgi:signal transduction histidine kinase